MRRYHVKLPLVFDTVLIFLAALSTSVSASELGTAATSPGAVPGTVLNNEFTVAPSSSEVAS